MQASSNQRKQENVTQSKFHDPIEKTSDKVSNYINERHAASMLAIAWHFTKRKDTIIAQLIQVDRLGFELRCHFHGATYSEERVNFPCGPIDKGGYTRKLCCYIMSSFSLSSRRCYG
jgi:hypothetical protein